METHWTAKVGEHEGLTSIQPFRVFLAFTKEIWLSFRLLTGRKKDFILKSPKGVALKTSISLNFLKEILKLSY